tara:strand:+ start:249 stop:509 length:261 start_codon:yes stop_codon:yes gene_type:complete
VPSYKGIPGASRFSKSTLDKVYKRGMGAYYSSGSRNVPAHAWAMGRVKSFVSGKGGARKADKDLLRKGKKTVAKTNKKTRSSTKKA